MIQQIRKHRKQIGKKSDFFVYRSSLSEIRIEKRHNNRNFLWKRTDQQAKEKNNDTDQTEIYISRQEQKKKSIEKVERKKKFASQFILIKQ